ncbi:cellulose biosynthesis protein BcsC [Pseudomonas oryzihabitans]|uniref:Tetratricopeptide (TPR) repeat protein n=1 Tax=Pseudomonas oryzihabitans TaxID=47885 RepID=A0AAJ2BFP9_9PSED|nr:cellulose synthase subunit BcsC-related outer membrane protein [Pseudomonas psychrotolerans]MDR6233284.1 tetratricopeptide (TPR) repeat protein [Pseudomonas psychrotolerans]MDR6357700.1 tetratricopeptide (TPR) repeat protein [Pseudomonas psychrotolerans]
MHKHLPLTLSLLAALIQAPVSADTANTARLLIEQGRFWQQHDKPERAREAWQKLLELDDRNPEALYGLGSLALAAKRPVEAQRYLARLQALSPPPLQAALLAQDIHVASGDNPALREGARRQADGGDRPKAVALYRQLFAGQQPQGLLAREYYNTLAFVDGGWPEAQAGFQRLLREYPNDPILALFYAKQLVRRDDTRPEGIRRLAALTQRQEIAGDADESWRLALTWMGAPDTPAKVSLFEDFLKAHPGDTEIRALLTKGRAQRSKAADPWRADPLVGRGLEALRKGDQRTAEQAFQERLKRVPKDPDALGGLGVLRQQQHRLDDAERLLIQAVAQPKGRSWQQALDRLRYEQLLARARSAQNGGDLNTAHRLIEQALRLDPKSTAGQLALADLQARSGNLSAAEAGYRQLLARNANDLGARRGLIGLLGQTGRSDEALRLADSLPRGTQAELPGLGQMRATVARERATVLRARGDLAGARAALQEALHESPDDPWITLDLARLDVAQGQAKQGQNQLDSLLQRHPTQADVLFVGALFASEQGDTSRAQALLARIPTDRQSPEIQALARRLALDEQLAAALALAKRGQREAARARLQALEAQAAGQPALLRTLANGYAELDDSTHALALLRPLVAAAPATDVDLRLQYAGVLLQQGDDREAYALLNTLADARLAPAQRDRYDELSRRYRIRQTDALRERGRLAEAYDVLAPALAQRPKDPQVNAALARLYLAHGDATKAVDLYRPLIKLWPDDVQLQLDAADAAIAAQDRVFAEGAIARAITLAPDDARVLTRAAELYSRLGRDGKATELLTKVVAAEQRDRALIASAAPVNPLASNGRSLSALAPENAPLPPPVGEPTRQARLLDTTLPEPFSTTKSTPGAAPYQPQPVSQTTTDNPFAAVPARVKADSRTGMSAAERALADIQQSRSATITQGLSVRSNNSESGLGKLTAVEAPLEIAVPVGDDRLAVRVTPVSLDAGKVAPGAADRFGGGPVASIAGGDPGSQKASGTGIAVAYSQPSSGLKADAGTTPLGFREATVVGGVSLERPLGDSEHARYTLSASRRAVIDSLTAFAGSRDTRTGQEWGGVTANGVRGQLSYDDGNVGAYAYASWFRLLGNKVEDNDRAEFGGGTYRYLVNSSDAQLTLGLSLTALGYANNQNFFTYGHGGYFSPQRFFALGVPLIWSQRGDRWTYQLRGTLGVQHFQQDAADYYPTDAAAQAAASQALGSAARYAGQSKTGLGYSLVAAGEYRLNPDFHLGGELGLDNARDYRQVNGSLYLRYYFEPQDRPLALPVSPYRSPYSN